MFEGLTGQEPHPVIDLPTGDQVSGLSLENQELLWKQRAQVMKAMEVDPLRYGYEPTSWARADKALAEFRQEHPVGVLIFLVLGGHRAGKTCWRSKRTVQGLFRNTNYKVWACQATQEASRESQQIPIYNYLPPEYKVESGKLRRGKQMKVNYTPWGGFTEDVFAVQNLSGSTSECRFKFYSMDAKSLEGAEINEGWCFIAGTEVLTDDGARSVEQIRPQQKVITRFGARKVIGTLQRRAKVGRVTFSDGKELIGTYDHLVLTLKYGWMKLGELERGDQVCVISALNGMAECGTSRREATTTAGKICTGQSGESISEQFQKDSISTTKTATSLTTPLKTWNACPTPSISGSMFLQTQEKKLGGIQSLISIFGVTDAERILKESDAYPQFVEYVRARGQSGFARPNAAQRVEFAEPRSTAGVEISAASVASTWEDAGERLVYNIKVQGVPEYFANGILVHNCDEEAPLQWLEALIYRLVSRNGILFMTFTPRWGYTQTVKTILQGAVTIEEGETDVDLIAVRNAKGDVIAAKKVPLVQENNAIEIPGHKVKGRIVYFHTCENPFPLGNWANMKETLRGASEEKILTVAYGVPTRSLMASFPMFRDTVHIISLNRFREIQKGGGVWYHFLDPCSGRNWFQQWIFVDPLNRAFVAGETPSHGHRWAYIPGVGDPGPWAVAGNKADGEMGEGQKEWGWGYDRYLEEMDRMERILSGHVEAQQTDGQIESGPDSVRAVSSGGPIPLAQKIKVEARWIDARYGNARRTTEERSVTLIEDLEQKGMVFLACPAEKFLYDAAKGGESLRMINNRLFYDTAKPIDYLNEPKLYVVETAPNTIFSLKEWSGKDGQHGSCKDPIDCLRMFVLSGSEYVPESLLQPRTPWLNQFAR